jgi:hypothetical protein
MSQLRKISDCVFTTPVDHQYDEHSDVSFDECNGIEDIIFGINCLMIETDKQAKRDQSFEIEEASTKSSSPFEDKSTFCKVDKINFFAENETGSICIRKKKIKISKCVKKNWKTKISNLKQMMTKSLTSKVSSFSFINAGMFIFMINIIYFTIRFFNFRQEHICV